MVEESHGDKKGTGRARQGSIRAPQWIKGGIAWDQNQEITAKNKQKRKTTSYKISIKF